MIRLTRDGNRLGESGRMVRGRLSPCHFSLFDRKIKKFMHRNAQSFGNLIDHAGGYIVFSPFDPPDLFAGIPHNKAQVFLSQIFGQSQLTYTPP